MKNTEIKNTIKREYLKPLVQKVEIDHEISLIMATDPPEPEGTMPTDHFSLNPFKMFKL